MFVDGGAAAGIINSNNEIEISYEFDTTDASKLKVFLWNEFSLEAISLDNAIER